MGLQFILKEVSAQMNREIVFIVYVTDIERSVEFYSDLLELETEFASPRYVPFAS